MGTAGECTQTRHLLGVYLLGAIDPAGRAAVDRHLAQCAECRKELAGMAGLPAMLSRVPAAEVYQPGEPAPAAGQPAGPGRPGLPRLLRGTATARRARRWRGLVLAAVVVVLAAALGAGVQHVLNPQARPGPQTGSWLAVSARNEQTLASATVAYSARGWGTALKVRVRQVPAGTTCQLWVTNRSGQQAEAGGWTIVRSAQRAWYPASTSFAASTLRSFAITTGHRTLVSIQVSR
jgi:anti-sigma factor RsiW